MEWKSQRGIFEDSYTAVEAIDRKGRKKIKYIYSAPWFCWNTDEESLTKRKRQFVCLALIGTVSFLAAGLIHSPNIGVGAIEVPALLALISMLILWYGILRFLVNGIRLTKPAFDSITRNIKLFSIAVATFSLFAGGANVWAGAGYLQKNTICVSLLYVISALATGNIFRLFSKIDFTSEKNREFFLT